MDFKQTCEEGRNAEILAVVHGNLRAVQWFLGHGSDPKDLREQLYKYINYKTPEQRVLLDFLEKHPRMPELFPVKEYSPLNYFSISNDCIGLKKYLKEISNDGIDAKKEVITYISMTVSIRSRSILPVKLLPQS